MNLIILVEILAAIILLFWAWRNYKENSQINRRYDSLLTEEDKKENTYKRIKAVKVNLSDGTHDIYESVRMWEWNSDSGCLFLYNDEGNAVAVYKIIGVISVHFKRDEEPTHD